MKCLSRAVPLRWLQMDTVRRKRTPLFLKLLAGQSGQDLIEYSLMAGFVALGAGAIMPGFNEHVGTIYSRIMVVLNNVASSGS